MLEKRETDYKLTSEKDGKQNIKYKGKLFYRDQPMCIKVGLPPIKNSEKFAPEFISTLYWRC